MLWEEKNNVRSERRWAGGKGINVARWLKHLGGRPQLVLPLGGETGKELAACLRDEKIPAHIVRLREPTRVNFIITTKAGRQMRFNPLGPKLSRREWNEVLRSVERWLRSRRSKRAEKMQRPNVRLHVPAATGRDGLLILSGSLPRGVAVKAYAQLVRLAHRFSVRTLLDCDGPAFAAAVKAHPFLVKPNEHELAQWWKRPLRSEAGILRAAAALSRQTRGWVLVSRGAKRSLLVNHAAGFRCFAAPPRVKPRNTVGAGDAMLAAVARQIQLERPSLRWLDVGLQVGSSATTCSAGRLPAQRRR